jgi:hypothetical protein
MSEYRYFGDKNNTIEVNVGWLDRKHKYPIGSVDSVALKNLVKILNYRVQRTRGYHLCNLCNVENVKQGHPMFSGYDFGSSEIRVFSKNGDVYAAPDLILHYIVEHNYLPPKAFVDALLKGIVPPCLEYEEKLRNLYADYIKIL